MIVMMYVMGLSMIILLFGIIATIGYVENKMKIVDGVIDNVNELNTALNQWKIFLDGLTMVEQDDDKDEWTV